MCVLFCGGDCPRSWQCSSGEGPWDADVDRRWLLAIVAIQLRRSIQQQADVTSESEQVVTAMGMGGRRPWLVISIVFPQLLPSTRVSVMEMGYQIWVITIKKTFTMYIISSGMFEAG